VQASCTIRSQRRQDFLDPGDLTPTSSGCNLSSRIAGHPHHHAQIAAAQSAQQCAGIKVHGTARAAVASETRRTSTQRGRRRIPAARHDLRRGSSSPSPRSSKSSGPVSSCSISRSIFFRMTLPRPAFMQLLRIRSGRALNQSGSWTRNVAEILHSACKAAIFASNIAGSSGRFCVEHSTCTGYHNARR